MCHIKREMLDQFKKVDKCFFYIKFSFNVSQIDNYHTSLDREECELSDDIFNTYVPLLLSVQSSY